MFEKKRIKKNKKGKKGDKKDKTRVSRGLNWENFNYIRIYIIGYLLKVVPRKLLPSMGIVAPGNNYGDIIIHFYFK